MPRLALPLSIALLAIAGAGAADAATVSLVTGDVRALALSGDALVVARVPPRRGLVLERLVPGSPAQTLLTTTLHGDDEISLAASADALGFGLMPEADEDPTISRVMIGPPAGPLREATRCPAGLIVSPVSVAGSRIAWREGACGEPTSKPDSVGPAAIVIAGADPAAPVRRVATPPERLPIAVVLGPGDTGLVGLLQPSFFGFDTEVRAFSAAGLGATIAGNRARLVTPVGVLADGTRVLLESTFDDDEDGCEADKQLFTLAPGAADRRPVPLGGCLISRSGIGPRIGTSPVATGDRIVAFVGPPAAPRSRQRAETVSLVSVRADGSDRRVVVKGGYRTPAGATADGGRVAWWQPRCSGGREVVLQSAPEATVKLAACRAEVLTRSARVRRGRIAVRLRCPTGCSGTVLGGRELPVSFAFAAGTHRVDVPFSLGRRSRATARLEVFIANGPLRTASISVRR